ncbi:putative U2 snRNP auxiliary factor small subunit [Histomonas meleagridis]|uniref:putative U2 snRNP auxiliary factor small subunit n=1 Tax=Histomonas meleagridis TaxID=135588 RepID=UPI003559C7D7|nr:putative U2 snRNP auxiliary factor small subunit [Histomonas meleagridis]KAH0800200.1 putative U2 snRNP auxiliary factor small subunit [Histomonas meleagridis]
MRGILKAYERNQNRTNPTCVLYDKFGVCPYGDYCPCYHIKTAFPRILILHHLYPNPEVFYCYLNQQNPKTEEEKQRLFDAFYYDIYLELRQFGEITDILVAGNLRSFLSGTVWVSFDDADSALAAHMKLNGRYYAGRKIKTSLWDSVRLSTLICNPPNKRCDKGIMCGYVHPIEPSHALRVKCFNRNSKVYPSREYEETKISTSPEEIMLKGVEPIKTDTHE